MKPLTLAQKIYGKQFDNVTIITERPSSLRSEDPKKDKILFQKYKGILRQQTKVIKLCLK